jgi:tRNA U34 2-thiouridine synthase MnmA/TrmU
MDQREGLGLSWKALLYVIAIDARRNTIIASEKQTLMDRSPVASEVTFVLPNPPGRGYAKVRNTHRAASSASPCRAGGSASCFEEPRQL